MNTQCVFESPTPHHCNRQCESVCPTHRGSGLVFCRKRDGHKGDHRGYRKQWDDKGKLKPITERMPNR